MSDGGHPGRSSKVGDPPFITPGDILQVIRLAGTGMLAQIAPAGSWRTLAGLAGRLGQFARRGQISDYTRRIEDVSGASGLDVASVAIAEELLANDFLHRLQILGSHAPRRWRPQVRLTGGPTLATALKEGKGAVLWVADTASASTVAKIALAVAGYRAVHLSEAAHGFATSRWGRRWLNPIRQSIENRSLSERVVLDDLGVTGALRRLAKALKQGEVISVTEGESGQGAIECDFLGGRLRLATGAPGLALHTGAPLLPVITHREPDGRYVVAIGEALNAPASGSRHDRAAALVRQFGAILEDFTRGRPGQWNGWRHGSRIMGAQSGPK